MDKKEILNALRKELTDLTNREAKLIKIIKELDELSDNTTEDDRKVLFRKKIQKYSSGTEKTKRPKINEEMVAFIRQKSGTEKTVDILKEFNKKFKTDICIATIYNICRKNKIYFNNGKGRIQAIQEHSRIKNSDEKEDDDKIDPEDDLGDEE